MNTCAYTTAITAIACAIYECTSADEAALIASVFNQLGDTLGTMAARDTLCSSFSKAPSAEQSYENDSKSCL